MGLGHSHGRPPLTTLQRAATTVRKATGSASRPFRRVARSRPPEGVAKPRPRSLCAFMTARRQTLAHPHHALRHHDVSRSAPPNPSPRHTTPHRSPEPSAETAPAPSKQARDERGARPSRSNVWRTTRDRGERVRADRARESRAGKHANKLASTRRRRRRRTLQTAVRDRWRVQGSREAEEGGEGAQDKKRSEGARRLRAGNAARHGTVRSGLGWQGDAGGREARRHQPARLLGALAMCPSPLNPAAPSTGRHQHPPPLSSHILVRRHPGFAVNLASAPTKVGWFRIVHYRPELFNKPLRPCARLSVYSPRPAGRFRHLRGEARRLFCCRMVCGFHLLAFDGVAGPSRAGCPGHGCVTAESGKEGAATGEWWTGCVGRRGRM